MIILANKGWLHKEFRNISIQLIETFIGEGSDISLKVANNTEVNIEDVVTQFLSHLPNDERKKVDKLLVEECKVFSKDENDIDCLESLKLKLNLKDNNPVSQTCLKIPKQLYNEPKQYLEDLLTKPVDKKVLFLLR